MKRRDAAFVLAAAALVCLLIGDSVHPAIAPLCLGWLVLQRFILDRARVRLPDAAVALLHVWLGAIFLWFALLGEREPGGGADMLTLLLGFGAPFLVLKLAAPSTRFNDAVTVLTCVILVLGAAATGLGLRPVFALVLFLATACLVMPALVRREGVADVGVRVRVVGDPSAVRLWRGAPAAAGIALALLGLALGSVLYLFVPRLAGDQSAERKEKALAIAERQRAHRNPNSGFAREVRLGDIGRIKRDERIAFEAQLRYYGRPYDPPPTRRSMLLLRARAWETYVPAERKWVRRLGRVRWLPPTGLLGKGSVSRAWPVDWQISMHGYGGRTLFLPQRAARIRSSGTRIGIDPSQSVVAGRSLSEYGVEAGDPVTSRVDIARLVPQPNRRELLEVPPALADQLQRYLPRVRGRRIADKVATIRRFFTQNEFRYTLQLPPSLPEDIDPIIAFLDRREGHCELYASAACLFLRLHGVPARLAGGVRMAQKVNKGYYRARYKNAHAWVEIACRDVGYVAFDFTPSDRRAVTPTGVGGIGGEEAAATLGIEGRRAQKAEAPPLVDWRRPFSFTRADQKRLSGRVMAWFDRRMFLAMGGALFVWGVFLLFRSGWRRHRGSSLRVQAPPGVAQRTLSFYRRWLKACAAKGHVRGRQQTPREFLRSLPPPLREGGREITAKFEQLRYGSG
ncbi:MAG: transglutaminase TgpA family protein [Planctomycetota bacterium]|jgi:transglutaminase-like putative cysteine protease